ncbi:MAG: hypothetical protein NTW03_12515 [Verrucomicrobia bacterium]|nr:hypothetical protein [Verrucomicrobiota bacterium]
MRPCHSLLLLVAFAASVGAADSAALGGLLGQRIIETDLPLQEVQRFTEQRVPRMPTASSAAEWEQLAGRMREDVLSQVVFRGAAAAWRAQPAKVEWFETIEGGPGYHIRKLRYEAAPGWWIPALLYEPENLLAPVPTVLNLNGHEGIGKSVPYKQIRCINQARRRMLALNPEWIGMGQFRTPAYDHAKMNQLDLCGASGLAVFYLAMARGLDVLLAHPRADSNRVAVAGLSGGGWQTIILSSLDPRVKLCNPVAGYSSFRTRARFLEDLGDSEQSPSDLATVADYAHLTALLAPRPALLTYNAKDNCCFAAAHALPPLLEAALPVYKLYGREQCLRSHINQEPGDHNFGQDNREASYRMIGDFFYAGQPFDSREIPCEREVKAHTNLLVALPQENATFNSLARTLSRDLPRQPVLPATRAAAESWQKENRPRLQKLVRAATSRVTARKTGSATTNGTSAVFWRLSVDDTWTLPATELSRGDAQGTVILIHDQGRAKAAAEAGPFLEAGRRVLALDLFYFGEARIPSHDVRFALQVAGVGERPLGIQAGQLAAVARWRTRELKDQAVEVAAVGPRSSVIALVAAGLEEQAIAGVTLTGSLSSLKQVIEQDWGVNQAPELFCFGLLEQFDLKHLAALVAPRSVRFSTNQ